MSILSRVRCETPSPIMQLMNAEPQNHGPMAKTCPTFHKNNYEISPCTLKQK